MEEEARIGFAKDGTLSYSMFALIIELALNQDELVEALKGVNKWLMEHCGGCQGLYTRIEARVRACVLLLTLLRAL